MTTYLLTWNPEEYRWDGTARKDDVTFFPSLGELISLAGNGAPALDRWSTGNRKYDLKGQRFFLLRQSIEPRGIVASGFIISNGYEGNHWRDQGKKANYAEVSFDFLIDADEVGALPIYDIQNVNWGTQSGGIVIEASAAAEVENRWRAFLLNKGIGERFSLPDETVPSASHKEGAYRQIWVNAYERSDEAREDCIAHYGAVCQVCDLNFIDVYGDLGAGYIHVHHLVPLAQIKGEYEVDPIKDLIPVCPNCHAMLHRQRNLISPADLRNLVLSRRGL